ncbi:hypothetical protein IF188_19700 [Microbacterium sp. NEAU-LLC]|uniref:Uncharacterized protein n=1 Tax=Microbacterium helvum TaxID=2773713 RepID=A0ABR8NTH7_9MICO|nr:hypothetical protein [Microbacterium helvum]MBD3943921.1 hypothetical protein [Microbacterium helvum]
MTTDGGGLQAGPRWRRLCLEYVLACARDGSEGGQDAVSAVFWAEHRLDPHPGSIIRFGDGADHAAPDPVVLPHEAASALARVRLVEPTWTLLRDSLGASVDAAKYWQEPDGRDVLAATAELRPVLARASAVIRSAPDADWWGSVAPLGDQWAAPWGPAGHTGSTGSTAEELERWLAATLADEESAARERPRDPRAMWSGEWWSTPPPALIRTTRSLGSDGPAALWWVEDSLGRDEAAATPVDAHPARVVEIDGPEDWADLCRRHPLDVTASRRHDWYRVTGREGRWVIPDWTAVAAEADGVHLTVRGYLSAATRLIDVDGDAASVLAGWNPDETYWFRGIAARPADAQRWRRGADGEWGPAS